MNISRSGYYKWLKTKDILNNYELNRKDLGELIIQIHNKKKSYGYRRINAIIRRETGWIVSNNLVHKVCKILKIKSKAKHYKYKKVGEESIKYPNLINGNWKTTRPLEKVVTDTTMICFKKKRKPETPKLRVSGIFRTFAITHGQLMEAKGIEPLSETPFPRLSTSVVYLLKFPVTPADKQAGISGSPNTFLRCGQAAGTFTTYRCPVRAVVLSYRTDADLGSNLQAARAYSNVVFSV